MKTSICQGCGRLIAWVKTPAGRNMPCDPDKVLYWAAPQGTHKIVTQSGQVVSAFLMGPPEKATGYGYISHWATCPQAGAFRGGDV